MFRSVTTAVIVFLGVCELAVPQNQRLSSQRQIKEFAFAQSAGVPNQSLQEFDYQRWVRAYRQGRFIPPYRGGPIYPAGTPQAPEPPGMITIVESEDWRRSEPFPDMTPRVVSHQCAIGTERQYVAPPTGASRGTMLPEKIQLALAILSRLPDDHSQLPPPGRRLVVAANSTGMVRVYDRANLSPDVLELAHLIGCNGVPWIMYFPMSRWWTLEQFSETGIHLPMEPVSPTMSPDGSIEVLLGGSYFLVVEVKTERVMARIESPAIAGHVYDFSNPRFTLDGHHLLVLSSEPRIHVYETATWKEVESLAGLPRGAVLFFPSSDWSRGVATSAAGEVSLWGWAASSESAKLEDGAILLDASFSPDNTQVATLTQERVGDAASGRHFRIWDSSTGRMISDLFPANVRSGMLWWSQGRYLLAREFGPDIGIWNAQSGAYRGEFSGCQSGVDRFAILLEDDQLFARCNSDAIVKWNAADALDRIQEFERSLPQLP